MFRVARLLGFRQVNCHHFSLIRSRQSSIHSVGYVTGQRTMG